MVTAIEKAIAYQYLFEYIDILNDTNLKSKDYVCWCALKETKKEQLKTSINELC